MIQFKYICNITINIENDLYELYKNAIYEDKDEWNLILRKEELDNYDKKILISKIFTNSFLCYYNNKLIWFIKINQLKDKKILSHNFNIWPLYINKNYRNKWIWKWLLNYSINYIIKKYNLPVINFILLVNKNNKFAIKLYKNLWFELVGERKYYLNLGENYFNVVEFQKTIMGNN
jgi:ribosomal protein S18 acetylase RimI-like enzyme